MNTKERLYAVIGGCVGAILAMVVGSFLPLGAQSQSDRFGEITCTGLKVINPAGRTMVDMGTEETGGVIGVWSNDAMNLRKVFLSIEKNGGSVKCFASAATADDIFAGGDVHVGFGSKDGEGGKIEINGGLLSPRIVMGLGEHGGRISVYGNNRGHGGASMMVDEYGGSFTAFGKREDGGQAQLGLNQYGGMVTVFGKGRTGSLASIRAAEHGGKVNVFRNNQQGVQASLGVTEHGGSVVVNGAEQDGGQAHMRVDKNGGYVSVFGNGNSKGQASVQVNEYGNGAIGTWDKNGYRQ